MYNPRFVGGVGTFDTIEAEAGEAIAKNDFVIIKDDGTLEVAAAGEAIFGIALAAIPSGSTGLVLRAGGSSRIRVLMDNDNTGTTFAATHVGARFDIAGTTGAQVVDTSTAAQTGGDTGQLLCIEYNPQGYGFDDDTSIGLFEVVETI